MINTHQDLSLADFKRLRERMLGDERAVEQLREDCQAAARAWGITGELSSLRKLWDADCSQDPDPALLQVFREDWLEKRAYRERIRQEGRPQHPRLAAWRDRQVARCGLSLGTAMGDAIVHPPWSVELTRGCSVGCWFCGLSAAGLTGVFEYTDENRTAWARLLDLMSLWMGPAARWGFCYWATDPLDNPDYEKFCCDFSDRLGMFPQTTTAQAWRDPERVKKLLRMSEERGCYINRFSVLTRGLLDKLHQQFTPQEMARVECVLQTKETPLLKAQAGHARDPLKARGEKVREVTQEPTTIACVTGLVFRMLEKTVELVTPCPADERWVNGYYVVRSASFRDLEHLAQLIEEWVGALPLRVAELPVVRLARGFQVHSEEYGLLLRSRFQEMRFSHPQHGGQMRHLARLLEEGCHSAGELSMLMLFEHGLPEAVTEEWLTLLFERGWLDEEPTPG